MVFGGANYRFAWGETHYKPKGIVTKSILTVFWRETLVVI